MRHKYLITLVLSLCLATIATAQNNNPFESIGKKGKIITLSNGKYEELFDQDSIQQIGTALVNIRQMKVVNLLKDEKEAQRLLDNSTNSRFLSVDPLTYGYPELTPYQYASNRPIDGIDRDGLEFEPYWSTTVPGKLASLKAKLTPEEYKRLDRNGLLFVGGGLAGSFGIGYGLTYGAGALLTMSTSPQIITTIGSVSTVAAKYGPDIANFVYGATTGDATEPIPSSTGDGAADAGIAFRNLFKKGNVILDFFGGVSSRLKNAISIDPKADFNLNGFKGTIENFTEIFKGTKFKQIVAENPYGSYDYLKAAGDLLEQGGTITVKGSSNNKYFNKILKGTMEGLENFTMESKKLIEPLGKTTDGKAVENKDFYEIILKRK